jgi:hypothetical protein
MWADANGVGKYILYERDDDLANSHPHYLALLEHIGRICYMSSMEIHTIVMSLEEEVRLLGRNVKPQPVKKAERRRKIKTPQESIEQLKKEAVTNPYIPKRIHNRKEEANKAKPRKLNAKASLKERKLHKEKKRLEKAERRKILRAARKKAAQEAVKEESSEISDGQNAREV